MTASDALLREAAELVVSDAWYREGEEVSTLPTRNLIRLRAALLATPPASAWIADYSDGSAIGNPEPATPPASPVAVAQRQSSPADPPHPEADDAGSTPVGLGATASPTTPPASAERDE